MTLKDLKSQRKIDPELDSDATLLSKKDHKSRVLDHLKTIYRQIGLENPTALSDLAEKIVERCDTHQKLFPEQAADRWNEADIALICYGDQVHDGPAPTLSVLSQFLQQHEIDDVLNIVHLLPINPYTSDDGFSVVDYRQIHPDLGDWSDVASLGRYFDLMLDLVLNHCSQESHYFKKFLAREAPFEDFFIRADPELDYRSVTRPRNLPLLSPKDSLGETIHVWTTFSDDQVDLNYGQPAVLLEMLDVLLFYVRNGGRIIRLDAIAYLWKQIGTTCIHLPETHEIVKLIRTCLHIVGSQTLLLTETNVPHQENISYFGDGDEAHLVYQFSLPPLLLDAFFNQDATVIANWLHSVCDSIPGTSYFNFSASHDGIGVRPLEGIVSPKRVQKLVDAAIARDGKVGMKGNSDGSESPYELNVTYLDMLLTDPESDQPGIERFITSQAVVLAMKGIPAIYFHSLFGTRNDVEAVRQSGIPRRINRKKFDVNELDAQLKSTESVPARILKRMKSLLEIRRVQPAFHPDAAKIVCGVSNDSVLAFHRHCDVQRITVLVNFSAQPQQILIKEISETGSLCDLISGSQFHEPAIDIPPHGVLWLTHETESD